MSDKNKLQSDKNPNKWIEEVISKNNITYYDYKHFTNIEKIENNSFEKVYRANWKNSEHYFALKSFLNFDSYTVKEIIREIELQRKVDFHNNIIRLYGITAKESKNNQLKKYLLVMEYVNGNSLQKYLKETFENFTWEDKYKLAYQLTCVISHLHNKGIVHGDLHSSNILVYQNTIKLTDLGLTKRIKELSEKESNIVPHIDQPYSLNKMSDVYSIGILLWEISGGQPSFKVKSFDADLTTQILQGYKETGVSNTPTDYFNLYIECWDHEPCNRPTMNQVVAKLKTIITKAQINNYELISQKFCKANIKEMEPTIQSINENIFEEDLSIVIDEMVRLTFKAANEGKNELIRRKYFFDFINHHKINLQEIFNWLLNNQDNSSNSVYLLGYLNYHGIGTYINRQLAIKLYRKAVELGNDVAKLDISYIYIYGKDDEKNYNKAFELSKILAEKRYPGGINRLGYCYGIGIGTDIDLQKALELYQESGNLGNSQGLANLGWCYEKGFGTDVNMQRAFDLYQKSADLGNSMGINKLGIFYNNGIGTNINKQKAFESFLKAADLENYFAQYNLALMYENGDGIKKNIDQAIYWYKKAAEYGDENAQNKLAELSNT